MLLTDNEQVNLADLIAIDPEISDIAEVEGITVEGPGGIIRQSWLEAAGLFTSALTRYGMNDRHSVISRGWNAGNLRAQLGQIVVSSSSPVTAPVLVHWLKLQALRTFYRAAMNRRQSDRYEQKLDARTFDLAEWWRELTATGVPIVYSPVEAPGALYSENAGEFTADNLSSVSGGTSAEASFDVAITYLDASDVEGGPSVSVGFTIPANSRISVSLAGLTPPSPLTRTRGCYATVTGWNVYAGATGGKLYLQNAAPIAIGTTSWTHTTAPHTTLKRLGNGQAPDAFAPLTRMVQRG
jgi:hypothetical protein